MSAPNNDFKVPARRWRRWSRLARGVFNETYRSIAWNWALLAPATLAKLGSQRGRRILAFNAAWLAADEAQRGLRAMGWRRSKRRLRVRRSIQALGELRQLRSA